MDRTLDPRVSVGELMAGHPWFETHIGPPDRWPQLLSTTVSICRHAPVPMAVLWGPDQLVLYNDAFAEVLGDQHPKAFGQPAHLVWPEEWAAMEPMLQRVWQGTASQSDDHRVLLTRNDQPEECHFVQWFSPITNQDGTIHGILAVAHETTATVLTSRRRRMLSRLAGNIGIATDVRHACALAMNAVTRNHPDLPFGVMYLLDTTRSRATRVASIPDDLGTDAFPSGIEVGDAKSPWPVREAAESGRPVCVDAPDGLDLPTGPWPEPPRQIVVAPILLHGVADEPCGILIGGINPYRPYDPDYEDFFDQMSSRVASAVSTATSREAAVEERVAGVRRQRLADAAPLISARQSRHSMLHQIALQARRIIGAHHAAAALVVGDAPLRAVAAMSSSAHEGEDDDTPSVVEVKPEPILAAGADPSPLNADDVAADEGLADFLRTVGAPTQLKRTLVVPIDGRADTRLGMIVISNPFDAEFGETEADIVEALAVLAAVAIENAEFDERLRRAYAAREEVLAIVSHDLRNPLNTVALALEVLLHVDLDAGQQHKKLEVAQGAIAQANRLIDDVLDAALLEAGEITVRPVPTDVHEILTSAADQLRPLVEVNELDLVVHLEDDLPRVYADPARLIQILQNLVANAVKVMRSGTITVHAHTEQHGVTFRIQDMGPGIAEDERQHLFKRYWRGSTSPRKSAGLGLAIARGLVERHGGRIWVESTEGAGATFAFTLPAAPSE